MAEKGLIDVQEWMCSLEAFQVIIYRRPNFLSWDFEFESLIGTVELRNIFHEKQIDDKRDSITLVFPERWINCSECHQLFPLLQKYYPSLKKLMIKTHAPLIITQVPAKYSALLTAENEIVEATKGYSKIDQVASIEDPEAFFKGISTGSLYSNNTLIKK